MTTAETTADQLRALGLDPQRVEEGVVFQRGNYKAFYKGALYLKTVKAENGKSYALFRTTKDGKPTTRPHDMMINIFG